MQRRTTLALAAAAALTVALPVAAQQTIKIGELEARIKQTLASKES